eukprot:NODE_33218_length_306_cov_2.016760.p2 GENE.NODE_33218_length_306_cov_2.016760~~NODE_33218_length_306_cov_2.016760.p2  ORF type:complete len:56 (+),score=5.52 NODE_33218_length_306_cov_2.016760:100-267(+)
MRASTCVLARERGTLLQELTPLEDFRLAMPSRGDGGLSRGRRQMLPCARCACGAI